ncbi:hypothetical protein C8F04DRAFT_1058480 [Mycena alexandri]|uniref:Uncharacterized protein n=1 Tax=Mycena alexandri TaxID=1745969 RepID=A0AAD6TL59_9AGAR|nr:hypothetical protein C8F04DRAFT_1058480 [Mycena alexandri]
MNRSVAQDSQRRRHSSLKSVRSRRSLASIPGGPALRTVDLSPRLDTPLPLSPRLSIASPASSSISAYSPFSPKFGSRLSRAFIPPLPSTNLPPTTAQRGGPIQISHPYALFPHPRKNVQTSPPVPTEPKFPEQLRQAVATPNTDFIPLDLPALGKPLSPTLSSFPSPPPVTSILKPKLRVRTRRSPAIGPIGPSPLRTMILPESVDSELASYSQIRLNKENMSAKDRQVSVHGSYASLGGTGRASDVGSGLGITRGTSNNLVLKAKRRHSSISSPCPSIVEEDDPGVLLGIIRELVEETSEWDPNSVFMSESFKNLLQESGMTPANSTHGDLAAEATDTQNKSGWAESDSDQSIRSVEADLGFLSLNILKHESFYDVGSSATDDSTRLVSFWDEDSGERSEIVGLAW